jgi:class 3 adenylate cyclase
VNVPEGTVTFVFTDIVGSTRLWERHPEQMRAAVQRHDELMRAAFLAGGGHVFKTVGDAFCVAFAEPSSALTASAAVQRRLAAEPWGVVGALEVRIGIHTGTAEMRDGDYFGGTLNRAARIEAAAHGGQVLVSGVTRSLVLDHPPEGLSFRDLGEHRLKSLERAEQLFQLAGEGLVADFPPPRSMSVLPNNLPAQTTSFIGRAEEMAAITARLTGPTKLLTLTGSGGTGKNTIGS